MECTIDGPAGPIPATFDEAAAFAEAAAGHGDRRCCVLAHPHPQCGGSRHDMVIGSLVPGLVADGVSCLRFDFRRDAEDLVAAGVEDLLVAAAWLRERTGATALHLVGYSFGSVVVATATAHCDADRCTLVAPPVGAMTVPTPTRPVRIVAGEADAFAPVADLERYRANAPAGSELILLPGVDHFFHGAAPALAEACLS